MTSELAQVESALERYGLLLEHDKMLPSVTRIVASEPIAGSWWGHPLGHRIYALLGELAQRSGALSTKIINGKVTYVHPRLWPAFLSVARADPEARLARVPVPAAELYACVQLHGPLRADSEHLPRSFAAASSKARQSELSKAIRALEARLLVHSDSLHTESGAHVKVLRTWPQWCSERSVPTPALPFADAKSTLDAAIDALCTDHAPAPKVPW